MKSLAKNTLLEIYMLKRIKERVADLLDERKDLVIGQGLGDHVDVNGLLVKVSETKGRKTFSSELASKFLKKKLGKRYNQHFQEFRIEKKVGAGEPPAALIKQMEKYFNVISVDTVNEKDVTTLPLGLSDDEITENCYEFGKPSVRMTTPTKVDDSRLLEYAGKQKLDTNKLLLG